MEGENVSPRVERKEERDEEAKMRSKRVYNEDGEIADYRKRKVTDTNPKNRITGLQPIRALLLA